VPDKGGKKENWNRRGKVKEIEEVEKNRLMTTPKSKQLLNLATSAPLEIYFYKNLRLLFRQ
jgi:hypothetical protein